MVGVLSTGCPAQPIKSDRLIVGQEEDDTWSLLSSDKAGNGIAYQEYVNELSYLLFLKMMQETN